MTSQALELRVIVDPRIGDRRPVNVRACAWLPGEDPVPIVIEDLSSYDFRASVPLALEERTMVRIGLPTGHLPHAMVARIGHDRVAFRFMSPIGAEALRALTEDGLA